MKKFIYLMILCLGLGVAYAADLPQVNLNTADAKVLSTLKGIGPKRAQAIIEYREKNGKFNGLDDLTKIKGITPESLAKLNKNNPGRMVVSTQPDSK